MGDKDAYLDFGVKSIGEMKGAELTKYLNILKQSLMWVEQDDFLKWSAAS